MALNRRRAARAHRPACHPAFPPAPPADPVLTRSATCCLLLPQGRFVKAGEAAAILAAETHEAQVPSGQVSTDQVSTDQMSMDATTQ